MSSEVQNQNVNKANTQTTSRPPSNQATLKSQVASLTARVGELQAELAKVRGGESSQETSSNSSDSRIGNLEGQRAGNAYNAEVNKGVRESKLQDQLHQAADKLADKQTESGRNTSVSDVTGSGSTGIGDNNNKDNPKNNNTPTNEGDKVSPTRAATANSLNTLAPGGQDPNHADLVSGLQASGGRVVEPKAGDNSMVSQFKGEANTNEDAVSNRNCGRCALLSTARAMGMGGDASTANSDLEKTGALMGQNGKNEYQGTQVGDFLTGAKNMGMSAKAGKGGVEQVKQQLAKGNQVVIATDPSKYTGFTKKGGHMVRVSGYNEEKDTFTLHDSLFQKPIEVQAKQLGKAMGSDFLGEHKNTMITIDPKKSNLDKQALNKVPEQQKSSSPELGSSNSIDADKKVGDKGPVKGSAGNEPSKIDNTSGKKIDEEPQTGNKKQKEEEKPTSLSQLYDDSGKFKDWTMNDRGEFVKKDKAQATGGSASNNTSGTSNNNLIDDAKAHEEKRKQTISNLT